MPLKKTLLLLAALFAAPTAAHAGSRVEGYGNSRIAACRMADARARAEAQRRGTCFDRCDPRSCTREGGLYYCSTEYAHHSGSCR